MHSTPYPAMGGGLKGLSMANKFSKLRLLNKQVKLDRLTTKISHKNYCQQRRLAEEMRDTYKFLPNGKPNKKPGAFIGVFKDGEVSVGISRYKIHTEDAAQEILPGGKMTRPMGWRKNRITNQLEWREIPTCIRCQGRYPQRLSPFTVKKEPFGPWGGR